MIPMAYWNRFLRSLRVELRRAILSKRFAICVICEVFMLILMASRHIHAEGAGVTYIFAWFLSEGFYMIFFVLPAVPFAHSYILDQHSHFSVQVQARVGKRVYVTAKACSTMLSGALSMVVSRFALLIGLSCLLPVRANQVVILGSSYEQWAADGHVVLYFLSQFLLSACMGGLVAAFALWVSTWMKNPFVITTAPLICYYAQAMICYLLGLDAFPYLSLSSIIFFTPLFSSLTVCLVYSCSILVLLTGLFMYLFGARVVREV